MAGNESPTPETVNRFYKDEANEPTCVDEKFAVVADSCSCVDPFLKDRPYLDAALQSVRISVVDPDGVPVDGALVTLLLGGDPAAAGAATDGTLDLELGAEDYSLQAAYSGFYHETEVITVGVSETIQVFTVVLLPISLECGDAYIHGAAWNAGTYEAVIYIGNTTGEVTIWLEAGSKPSRFDVLWGGAVVADSLFVGNDLAANVGDIIDGHSFSRYALKADESGYHNIGDINVIYTADDHASLDPADTRASGGHGNQLGVVVDHPLSSSPAYEGTINLKFNKTTAAPYYAVLRVTQVAFGSAWTLLDIDCPA